MDRPGDFACIVFENGGPGDCDVVPLTPAVAIETPAR
jgi:hypothetical protein